MKQKITMRQLSVIVPSCSGQIERIRDNGYLPAFYDQHTMTAELSRFTDGMPAPVHLLDGLPDSWVAKRSPTGKILALKESVTAGYLYNGFFYTPEEVACAIGL
jgi:hypothetical protein